MRLALIALAALALAPLSYGCSVDASEEDAESATSAASTTRSVEVAPGGVRVRVVAANITSGDHQAYEAPGTRILQGLKPDVALLQEFNYESGTIRDFVDVAFGADFVFFRETQNGGIPNGVVSRYPIVASGQWADPATPNRSLAWARIDIPGPTDLWAFSVHFLTSGAGVRANEATLLVNKIRAVVPAGDYVVIGGDFNTNSPSEQAVKNLAAVTVTSVAPTDGNGNRATNATRKKPYDWLVASPAFDAASVPVEIGTATFPKGLVFDSRVFVNLADVAPVARSDSGANRMQHMAVVRDFVVQP